MEYLTCTLVNLDSNCAPTDGIVQLLGETSSYLRVMDVQSTACAIEFATKNIFWRSWTSIVRNQRGTVVFSYRPGLPGPRYCQVV